MIQDSNSSTVALSRGFFDFLDFEYPVLVVLVDLLDLVDF
jgi:hypothetical protein